MSKQELKTYLVRLTSRPRILRMDSFSFLLKREIHEEKMNQRCCCTGLLLTLGPVFSPARSKPYGGTADGQEDKNTDRRRPTRGQRRFAGQRPCPAAAHCRVPHPLGCRSEPFPLAVPARRRHRHQLAPLRRWSYGPQDHRHAHSGTGRKREHSHPSQDAHVDEERHRQRRCGEGGEEEARGTRE